MKKANKGIVTLLASTAVLGALAFAPVFELQAKASVDSQTKAKTKAAAVATASSQAKQAATTAAETTTAKAIEAQLAAKGVNFTKLTKTQQADTYVDVVVQMQAAPAAENGSLLTNASTAEIQAATNRVIAAQAQTKAAVAAITNQGVGESYGYVINGFTTKAKISQLSELEKVAGVKSVSIAKVYYTDETSSNDMANVSTVWSNYKYKGQGTVVSIIDTGIDPNHKDMRLSDPSTEKLTEADVDNFTAKTGYGKYFTDKVPYGHNYADNNEIITDDTVDEQHGMHVSGIVAANGTGSDPTKSVVGVAPEAQLLAMKVFSNSDVAATTDSTSVIGAIDDSAKLGADVLNMSLGSTSGEQTEDDPEVAAVENAINAGTAAAISAGNDGTSDSDQDGTNVDYYGNPDMETIGTPGTTRDATTVASAENTQAINDAITITANGTTVLGPSLTQTSTDSDLSALSGKQFYVARDANGDVGVGTADQFTADAKGKVAVVKRGDINFTDKQANAQAAGAVGLIIINNAGGNEALTSVQYNPGFPTAGISTADGDKLLDYLDQNPDATFDVTIGLKQMANDLVTKDKMSTFTSYGPVSDLSFKPDITAPGGNIWSTQNNNGYTNMSGTSMASPFIAGTQALLTQAMNDKTGKFYAQYQQMTGAERVAFMKTIEMNTASTITDVAHDGVIESPRRQGAGMVDVDAAINAIADNPSTVTGANDYPGIELKSFDEKTHQFTVKFTNRTDKALTYTLADNGKLTDVYTSATDATTATLYDKQVAGASVKAADTIAVPAGTTKEFTFTLTLPDDFDRDQYVEGFLNFTGSDQSKLSIPYMGFYGDWADPAMIDDFNGETFRPLVTGNTGTVVYGGNDDEGAVVYDGAEDQPDGSFLTDPTKIAFSTDKYDAASESGAEVNWIQPEFWLLRNTNDLQMQILNQDGNVISTLATYKEATKSYYYLNGQQYLKLDGEEFDGTYFNQQDDKEETLPDGVYTYRVVGTPDGTTKQQTFDFKVTIDSVKPVVRNLKLTQETDANGQTTDYLTAEAKDDRSGLATGANTAVNGVQNDGDDDPTDYEVTGTTADGYTEIKMPLSDAQTKALVAGHNSISLALFDNASNAGTASATAQKPGETSFGLVLANGGLPAKITSQTAGLSADGTSFALAGNYDQTPAFTYTDPAGKVHDGTVTAGEDGDFTANLPLTAADYTTTVTFYTDDTKSTALSTKQVQVALQAPTFDSVKVDGQTTFTSGDQAPTAVQSSEAQATVTGTVSADTKTVQAKVGDQTVDATVNPDHTFSVDVPLAGGDNAVTLTATDEDGNVTQLSQQISSSDYGPTVVASSDVTFDNGIAFGTNEVTPTTKNYDPKTGDLTISGKVKRQTTNLTIGGNQVKINNDGTFSTTLHVGTHSGANFGVLIGDDTVGTVVQERLSFYVDANAPTLTVDQAKDADGDGVNDPIHTSDPHFTISGHLSDDYLYYDLYINDNDVESAFGDVDMNSTQGVDKDFSHTVTLKPGKNTFNVVVKDYLGNASKTETLTVYYDVPSTTTTTTTTSDAALAAAKAKLRTTLTQARSLGASADYTHDTAAVLAQARQQAQKVLNDKTATLADVQAAQTALDNAIAQLQKKAATTTPTVDPNADILAAIAAAKQSLGTTVGQTKDPATGRTYYGDLDYLTQEVKDGKVSAADAQKQLNAFLNQAGVLDEVQAAKAQAQAAGLGETKSSTGRTFNGDFDDLYNQAKAGALTPAAATTQLNAILDDALDTLTAELKQSTPVAVGNAKDPASGRSWYGDIDNAHNVGKAATTPEEKLDQLVALTNLKPLLQAQVKVAAADAYAKALAAKNEAAAAQNTAANNTRFGGADIQGDAEKANAAAAQAAKEAAQVKLLAQQAQAEAAAKAAAAKAEEQAQAEAAKAAAAAAKAAAAAAAKANTETGTATSTANDAAPTSQGETQTGAESSAQSNTKTGTETSAQGPTQAGATASAQGNVQADAGAAVKTATQTDADTTAEAAGGQSASGAGQSTAATVADDAAAAETAAGQPVGADAQAASAATSQGQAQSQKALPATGEQAQTGLLALGAMLIAGVMAFFGKKKADER